MAWLSPFLCPLLSSSALTPTSCSCSSQSVHPPLHSNSPSSPPPTHPPLSPAQPAKANSSVCPLPHRATAASAASRFHRNTNEIPAVVRERGREGKEAGGEGERTQSLSWNHPPAGPFRPPALRPVSLASPLESGREFRRSGPEERIGGAVANAASEGARRARGTLSKTRATSTTERRYEYNGACLFFSEI